jgi:hypothetical protein
MTDYRYLVVDPEQPDRILGWLYSFRNLAAVDEPSCTIDVDEGRLAAARPHSEHGDTVRVLRFRIHRLPVHRGGQRDVDQILFLSVAREDRAALRHSHGMVWFEPDQMSRALGL